MATAVLGVLFAPAEALGRVFLKQTLLVNHGNPSVSAIRFGWVIGVLLLSPGILLCDGYKGGEVIRTISWLFVLSALTTIFFRLEDAFFSCLLFGTLLFFFFFSFMASSGAEGAGD